MPQRFSRFSLPQQFIEWDVQMGIVLENTRRKIIDQLVEQDYAYVHPPIIEHEDTLSVGQTEELENKTFRFVDPVSGKMLAVRSDISPQIARIDQNRTETNSIAKYCYAGEVLQTHAEPLMKRNPYQVGAEIFGNNSIQADIEILNIALSLLEPTHPKHQPLLVDLGHQGILKLLLEQCQFDNSQLPQLFAILHSKSMTDLQQWLTQQNIDETSQKIVTFLIKHGSCPASQLNILSEQIKQLLPQSPQSYLQDISQVINQVNHTSIQWNIDVAELRGYHYHTGLTFAIYANEKLLCRGGRFHPHRTATGFTFDLNTIIY